MHEILLFSAGIAGISVLWRIWTLDHPNSATQIKTALGWAGKIVHCGPCFVTWITALFLIFLNPFPYETTISGLVNIAYINQALTWLIQWMTISYLAMTLRFIFLALLEFHKKQLKD